MNRKDYEYQSFLARQLVDLRQRNLAGKMSDEEFKARWDRIAPEYETLRLRGITEGYGFLVATIIQSVLEPFELKELQVQKPAPRTITDEQLYEDFKQCLVHPDWQNRKISELIIVDFNNLTLRINKFFAGEEK